MERVLVRIPNWLGDALLARPLLHALRRAHPRAEVRVLGPAALVELLSTDPVADAWEAWPAGARERRERIAWLRAWRPDAALVLPPSFSSAWLAWRIGARVRIGYAHEGRSPLLTRALARPPRGERHLSDEYLELGRALGVEAGPTPALPVPAERREEALALLRARAPAGGRVAILGPGAIYGPAKRWDQGRFALLAGALARDGWRVLVCGAKSDREVCAEVAERAAAGVVSLAGETGITLQAALCSIASLAVCNDSGLAHVAAAVGAPTVVIFGSTSSAWSAPLGERVRVVQRAPVCSPCFQRTCRIGYVCLTAIAVEDVARACREVAA
ncbi:MAG TPA: lipopolysaccharide heptosyltransferase II [Candidatus Eisenbacteria bacterium]|jgi:heptosyltransferase-2